MAIFNLLREKLKGVKGKWSDGVSALFDLRSIDESFWEDLEALLIAGDVGVDTASSLVEELKERAKEENIKDAMALKECFASMLIDRIQAIDGVGEPLRVKGSPSVIMIVGVNGSGKTTTAAKLAALCKKEGKNVILAAADTFRAAAVDQLKIWGDRIGVRVVAHPLGGDASAVIYDAIHAAFASKADLVIADTAGRLHTKHNLMEELKKMKRVIDREIPGEPSEILIVLDAVTGQNGFAQALAFHEALSLTGAVLAKYDSTAKGGIIIAVADRLGLPIRYVGLGESIDDLCLFDPHSFVKGLLDMD